MDGMLLATDRPIAVAIVAMGGQGGGVLADWIVAMAEAEGWVAQSTSVPGVAQRTGATIYYVEMIRPHDGARPILSLMPVPGDVDVVIAAELMEAGRAIQRGLVSPDRTTLVASSHRSYSVPEKAAPGDGIADPSAVLEAAHAVSKHFVCADMQALAEGAGSAISASLFGALAASGALPFPRDAFEAAIRAGGIGVEPSLRAFAAGFEMREPDAPEAPACAPLPPAFAARIATFCAASRDMLGHGVRRLRDYQDEAYAHEYLDRVARFDDETVVVEAAKQVAVALSYDDVIRVADLKTRAARFARVRDEIGLRDGQLAATTEFMHPRLDEVVSLLPPRLGTSIENAPRLSRALRRVIDRGRRVRTDTLAGFIPLYLIAGLRRWRRSLLRHQREMAHIDAWLAIVAHYAPTDPPLAVEILKCRRLVKGYSDTHARGLGKFDRVVGALARLDGRADAAAWVRRLREAALADENGAALDGALATVASL